MHLWNTIKAKILNLFPSSHLSVCMNLSPETRLVLLLCAGSVINRRAFEELVIVVVAEVVVNHHESGGAHVAHHSLALSRHRNRRPEVHRGVESATPMVWANAWHKYAHRIIGVLFSAGIVLLHLSAQPLRVVCHHEHISVFWKQHPGGVEEVVQGQCSEGNLLTTSAYAVKVE